MSFPTLTQVYEQTRAECGDTEVVGGQIYTDPLLLPHIQNATRVLWRGLRNLATPRVRRTFYYTLPANTSVFFPATALITQFSDPSGNVARRGGLTSVAISAALQSGANLAVTTSTAHGLTTGNTVTLEQIVGLLGANTQCTVTVTSATEFTANGVLTTGTYSSGGYVVYSNNEFQDIPYVRKMDSAALQTSNSGLSQCLYEQGQFRFVPASEAQQLRISYWASAEVPTSGGDEIAFNDCLDFLALYAASKAQKAQGANDRAATAMVQAVGPDFDRGVIGGELKSLVNSAVREMQNLSPYERSPKPFREQGYDLGYPL